MKLNLAGVGRLTRPRNEHQPSVLSVREAHVPVQMHAMMREAGTTYTGVQICSKCGATITAAQNSLVTCFGDHRE